MLKSAGTPFSDNQGSHDSAVVRMRTFKRWLLFTFMIITMMSLEFTNAKEWARLADCDLIDQGIVDHSIVAWNGDIYVFGGIIGDRINDRILKYDVTGNSWSTVEVKGPKPPLRKHATAVTYRASTFMFGGAEETSRGDKYLNDLWEFNHLDRTWKLWDSHPAPWPRIHHGAAVWDGNLIVVGGVSCSDVCNVPTRDIWRIQLDRNPWLTGFWHFVASSPYTPEKAAGKVAIIGNDIYTSSGLSIRKYSMLDGNWTTIPLPEETKVTDALFEHAGHLFLLNDHSGILNLIDGTWTRFPDEKERHSAAVLVLNNHLYRFGGRSGVKTFKDLYKLNLESNAVEVRRHTVLVLLIALLVTFS